MPSEDTTILEFNQYQKFDKAPFTIYADLACIIEKIDGCKNNPEIHLHQKQVNIFYQVFQSLQYQFYQKLRKQAWCIYRGKDCMNKFCEFLRYYAMKIINLKKKKKEVIKKEQQESYENAKFCFICKEKFENKYFKIYIYIS